MKKLLSLFILTLLPLIASADDSGSCGENVTYTYVESTKTLIISGTGDMTDFAVNATKPWTSYKNDIETLIIEDGVTSIGEWTFSDCGIKTVSIGNSVTTINNSAFSSSGKIEAVSFGSGITTIGRDAFSGCYSLNSLMLNDALTSIGNSAFFNCRALTSINIPRNVQNIGSTPFGYCYKLASITVDDENSTFDSRGDCNAIIKTATNELIVGCKNTVIPSTIDIIGASSFIGCSNLLSIVIPSGVTSIDNNAFSFCTGLTSIVIPNTVNSIGINPFTGCEGIEAINVEEGNDNYDSRGNCNAIINTSTNTLISGCKNTIIPNSVISIGTAAFRGSGLSSITIPNSVTTIGYGSFEGCEFSSIDIPNSVITIDGQAFITCTNLETVIIPKSITSIGAGAFLNCRNLSSVTIMKESPISIVESVFHYRANAILYVPAGSKAAYEAANYWKEFKEIVEVITKRNLIYYVDGEEYLSQEVEVGSAITPEADPVKTGYTFSGWSEIPETMPDHDVTVTGTFSVNKHHLIYMVDGMEYSNTEVEYGTAITALAEPSQEGYTFSGWSEIPETMPDHDVTVTGTFSVNKYHLIYMVDGEEYSNTEVEYGTAITALAEPSQEGYTFSGWSEIPETMPDHDLTITGTFSINTYQISISIENGSWGTVMYGEETINSASKTYNVNCGSNVNITITPNAGYALKWVKVDEEDVKSQMMNGVLTISNITAATQVALRFVEITTLTLASTTATFCSSVDLDFSDLNGLKAYVGSEFNENTNILTLRRVYDVKAGTGLVLMGTPGTYNVMKDEATNNYTNLLTGVTTNTLLYPTSGGNANYILSSGLHGIGFYPVRRAGYISAGKAYLSLPLLGGHARQVIAVGNDEDDTTGIIGIESDDEADGEIYNIQGQRVESPIRTGIFIKNGQKIVIKK